MADLKRGPVAWLLSLAIALPALVGLAGSLERKAIYNWDLMGYVGCLVELETDDPSEIHQRVLEVVATEVPAAIRPRLLADPQFRHHPDWAWGREVATDSEAFARQLDWYRPRVGFTALMALVHRGFGLQPLASLRAVVTASHVALGLLLLAWLSLPLKSERLLKPFFFIQSSRVLSIVAMCPFPCLYKAETT